MNQDNWRDSGVKSENRVQNNPNRFIEPRECEVTEPDGAEKQLQEWVQEHGITVEERNTYSIGEKLATKTREAPNGHSTVFKVDKATGSVVYCYRRK